MKTYLVGGAVRDELLGLPVKERDWVVVGAKPQELIELGYQPVGKDFPVFLHPQTKEEYALARTERKSGRGYHGFHFHVDEDVTLEQDLARRDLTINAIAKDIDSGEIIDPFNGVASLKKRELRHVAKAFIEDPLRVLRVARFKAQFAPFNFDIAPETQAFMYQMVKSGELNELVAERVWLETTKALATIKPSYYFASLRQCQALKVIFPELEALFGVPARKNWHGEIDTGVHTLMVLDEAAKLSSNPVTRFAALVHDLGKALTPFSKLPSHHGHGEKGVKLVEALCNRLKVPSEYQQLAQISSQFHTTVHQAFELSAKGLVNLFSQTDAFRKPERFQAFLVSCLADAKGRLSDEVIDYPQSNYLKQALDFVTDFEPKSVIEPQMKGHEIKQAIHKKRLAQAQIFIEKRNQHG